MKLIMISGCLEQIVCSISCISGWVNGTDQYLLFWAVFGSAGVTGIRTLNAFEQE